MIKKIKSFFREIRELKREYGFCFSISLTIKKYFKFDRRYQMQIVKYLDTNYDYLAKCSKYNYSSKCENGAKIIWFPWWQGEESMPEIVKKCYQSIISTKGIYKVCLISKETVFKYIDIPDYIYSKFLSGNISVIHLCDYIRVSLLEKYGGIWLDGTVFSTDEISHTYTEYEFFSRHTITDGRFVANGRWSGYFLCSSKSHTPLFAFLKDFYLDYWKKHNVILTYLLLDYLIDFAFRHFEYIRQSINSIPFNNQYMKFLQKNCNQPYDEAKWESIKKENSLHKLSWRIKSLSNDDFISVVVLNNESINN